MIPDLTRPAHYLQQNPNGKLERYHQSIKQEVNQLPYQMPADLDSNDEIKYGVKLERTRRE